MSVNDKERCCVGQNSPIKKTSQNIFLSSEREKENIIDLLILHSKHLMALVLNGRSEERNQGVRKDHNMNGRVTVEKI